jgi:hypothetical protein
MTEEKLDAIIEKWVNQQFSGGSSGSSSNDSSGVDESNGVTYDPDFLPIGELGQGTVGGYM